MKTYRLLPFALLLTLLALLLGLAPARAATPPNAWQIADVATSGGSLNYFTNLTAAQRVAATNDGWRFTFISRLVEGSGSTSGQNAAHYMTFGIGTARFRVGWDTNPTTQGWLLSSPSTPGAVTDSLVLPDTTNALNDSPVSRSQFSAELAPAPSQTSLRNSLQPCLLNIRSWNF